MKKNILVTGATGQVGARVLEILARDSSIALTAGVRSPEKLAPSGNRAIRLDYDDPKTLAPALAGIDGALLVTGYTVDMLRQSKRFIDHARHARVRHIVHLGACGDDNTDIAHYGWHQLIERYIEWSGIAYTHLRPEIFMQNLLGYGGARTVIDGVIRHYVGNTKLSWVDCDDVAQVAAACLRAPGDHAGKVYRLGYEARTYDQIAEIFSRVLGQPFRYEARPPAEFLDAVLAAGAEPAYMHCVFDSYRRFTEGDNVGADEVFDNFEKITGRKPGTIAEFANRNSDAFRYGAGR
jgi:NAD(P)H dehydrogenase (quinone)